MSFKTSIDLVLNVNPSRGEQIHLDDSVPILVGAGGHEASGLLRGCSEAIGAFVREAAPFGWVVGVRLAGRICS